MESEDDKRANFDSEISSLSSQLANKQALCAQLRAECAQLGAEPADSVIDEYVYSGSGVCNVTYPMFNGIGS